MNQRELQYNWSDAWLLLAVIYAGNAGATLERIIAVADGINHAIFNPEELESGLARLTAGGHLTEEQGVFRPAGRVMNAYSKTTSPRRTIEKELKDIETYLGAASSDVRQPQPNNLRYPGFSKAAYDRAVDAYVGRHS